MDVLVCHITNLNTRNLLKKNLYVNLPQDSSITTCKLQLKKSYASSWELKCSEFILCDLLETVWAFSKATLSWFKLYLYAKSALKKILPDQGNLCCQGNNFGQLL